MRVWKNLSATEGCNQGRLIVESNIAQFWTLMVNVGSDTSDVVASKILTNISMSPVSLGEPGWPGLGISMSPVSLGERAWANPVGLGWG